MTIGTPTLNYTTYVSQAANLTVISSNDANFQTMLPGMIDYAEQRIYRELDLLYTVVTDATTQVSTSQRRFTLPTGSGVFVVVDAVNIITPVTATSSTGSRTQLVPVSREFMDAVYPSGGISSNSGVPQYFSMVSNSIIDFGPSPDAPYYAEVIGTTRPTPLSAANSSTILTQYVPDLFMAASMVFAFGYMRDFGGQTDNPGATQSWENQYQTLLKSAAVEQSRLKFQAEGWTAKQPSPLATPKRV